MVGCWCIEERLTDTTLNSTRDAWAAARARSAVVVVAVKVRRGSYRKCSTRYRET